MTIKRAILIGFGHHGRNRLFKSLLNIEQIEQILIYDINKKATDLIEQKGYKKSVEILTSLDSVYRSIGPDSFVVIGTTAKNHLELFKEVVQRGAMYLYLEKPLAQSLADSYEIADLARMHNVKVAVGFFNDFIPLTNKIKALEKECGLGPLVKVSSEGGAACLSTCGLHVIDLAGLLFGAPPNEVYGKITSRIQNPRGTEYFTFGGLIHAFYEGRGELVLSYNNQSIVTYDIALYFEYGLVKTGYEDEFITVYGFHEDYSNRPKYRYANPTVVKQIPNTYDFNGSFDTIFNNLLTDGLYCGIDRALKNMQVLIGAMISDSKGVSISLPIGSELASFRDRYPIT
jgi:predicted dehydrogenase